MVIKVFAVSVMVVGLRFRELLAAITPPLLILMLCWLPSVMGFQYPFIVWVQSLVGSIYAPAVLFVNCACLLLGLSQPTLRANQGLYIRAALIMVLYSLMSVAVTIPVAGVLAGSGLAELLYWGEGQGLTVLSGLFTRSVIFPLLLTVPYLVEHGDIDNEQVKRMIYTYLLPLWGIGLCFEAGRLLLGVLAPEASNPSMKVLAVFVNHLLSSFSALLVGAAYLGVKKGAALEQGSSDKV